jgi:hypothetical protein
VHVVLRRAVPAHDGRGELEEVDEEPEEELDAVEAEEAEADALWGRVERGRREEVSGIMLRRTG